MKLFGGIDLPNKLSRACYYVMRDEVPFDVARAFA
jgi:hypothetical protein